MAGSLDVVVKFIADATGVKDEVDKVSSTGDTIKGWAKGAALAIGGAFAVDKVVEFGKASVDAAAEDKHSQEILAQTLRNTQGASDAQIASVEKSISKMSEQYHIADDQLRPAFDTLQRATGNAGKSQDLLQIAMDASAGTGKDLATITTAMGKAAMGSTGGLAKLGIETKGAHGEALTADQVFKNMADTFKGQAGVAADSAAGKMAGAKVQMQEFQEKVGGYVLPIIATLADFFSTKLLPAVSGFINFISDHKDLVISALIGFGVVVGAIVVPMFLTWAASAAAAAAATLLAIWPVLAIGAAVAGVAYLIISNWNTIRDVTVTVWHAVLGAVQTVWNWVRDNWPLLLAILLGPITAAGYLIWKFFGADIKQWAGDAVNFIRGVWDGLVGFFTALPGRIVGFFTTIGDGIKNAFRSAFNFVADAWNNTIGKLSFHIPDWVPGLGGKGFDVPDIPHFAQGGIVTRPTLALIGEAGPEAVVPLGRGGAGPAVHIEHATFNSAVDVDLLSKRLEFLTGAGMRV